MAGIDVRSVLLARHAQHVVFVHFPIGLFLAGVFFDGVAWKTSRQDFATAAYFNLVAAAMSVPLVVATGILAWQWQLEGQKLRGVLLLHFVLACVVGVLICVLGIVRYRARNLPLRSPSLLISEAGVALALAVTAHLGGVLSGVNIPG